MKRQPVRIAAEQGGDSALHFFPELKSAYHSNLVILPPSAHFATHPGWYFLVDGVRKPVQLCMTNPEMKAEYIRSIRKLLAAHPESDFILVRLLNWKSWELGSEDERQELLASWEVRCREFGVESCREAFDTDDFDRCVANLKKGLVPDGVNTPKRKP